MQGGHNDEIVNRLYTTLSSVGKQHLKWHWYVAKDQTRPIVASKKKRNCHIKLMIVDEHVAIQGNGNQDTQSWYHSQEINIMYDSPLVCRAWIEALRRNQNTGVYGGVSTEDGIWRDEQGNLVDGAIGPDAGRFAWAKGIVGAVKRVRGTGGF
jgi:phosphatidylserine/phosphatidylglycerophosphate/cardiolipin synthase-like enzyme